jgi:hypothetical protein
LGREDFSQQDARSQTVAERKNFQQNHFAGDSRGNLLADVID